MTLITLLTHIQEAIKPLSLGSFK